MSVNRRQFLEGAAACAAGGAAAVAAAGEANAIEREAKPRLPEALGLMYDSTLCVGCKACVAGCKAANDMPADISPDQRAWNSGTWDTPKDLSGKTLNIIKVYRDGSMEQKDRGGRRLRLHQAAVPALRRSVVRLLLPGFGDDQGPGDGCRAQRPGALHRLPLLRLRLPLPGAEVRVRPRVRQNSEMRAVSPPVGERPTARLRRTLPDGSNLVRPRRRPPRGSAPASGTEAGRPLRISARRHQRPLRSADPAARKGRPGRVSAGGLRREGPRRNAGALPLGRSLRQARAAVRQRAGPHVRDGNRGRSALPLQGDGRAGGGPGRFGDARLPQREEHHHEAEED